PAGSPVRPRPSRSAHQARPVRHGHPRQRLGALTGAARSLPASRAALPLLPHPASARISVRTHPSGEFVMPSSSTPEPITLRVKISGGQVVVEASDRADTEVTVLPGDPSRSGDVEA